MNQLLSLLQIIIVTIILHSLLTSRNCHVEASEYRITRVERVQAVAPNSNHYLRANGQHHKRQHIEKIEYVRAEPVAAPLHSNIHNESYHHHHHHQQRYPNTHSNPRENDQQQQQQHQHSNHKHDSTEHHHHHKRQHNTNDTPGHKNPKNDLRKEDAMKTTANDVLAKEGPATTTVNHNGSNKNNITKEARD